MTVLVVAEAVVIALLAVLVIGLLRSHAEILRRLHELDGGRSQDDPPFRTADDIAAPRQPGAAAHDISGVAPGGGATAIRVRRGGRATLLAFMSSTCPTCSHFWERFDAAEALASLGELRLVIVTKGPEEESPAALGKLVPDGIPSVMSSQAWVDYAIPGSPYFVLVDGTAGSITGEGSASDWDKLLDLMGIADDDTAVRFSDDARAARVDQQLADAGILPGDPRLYGENGLQANGER